MKNGPQRILLIDDDELVRKALAAVLTHAGFSVEQAADGDQAVERLRANPADLVITDLVMPGREGLELIGLLHLDWPSLPIIAMSGCGPRSALYLDMAAKFGARRTLTKPFASEVLLHAVEELLAPPPKPPAVG